MGRNNKRLATVKIEFCAQCPYSDFGSCGHPDGGGMLLSNRDLIPDNCPLPKPEIKGE